MKDELKKLIHMCYTTSPPFSKYWIGKDNTPSFDKILESKYYEPKIKNLVKELKKYFSSELEAKLFWCDVREERNSKREIYNKKPNLPKQDNKNVRIGSGHSNRNKIRFPKKCRKTAWKRFRKLFPELQMEDK